MIVQHQSTLKMTSSAMALLQEGVKTDKITIFQHKVYQALLRIPPGKVSTYKELAQAINCNSSQAVGQALRRNPFAPQIPCHRVVKTDLSVGGFMGNKDVQSEACQKKISLLTQEGVDIVENQRHGEWTVNPDCLFCVDKESHGGLL